MDTFTDEDLVYVDPDAGVVVGRVEWSTNGKPKSLAVPPDPEDAEGEGKGRRRRKYYPWGTYRSMKKIYKLEGKIRSEPSSLTLDEAIVKALEQPYWN